MKSGQVTHWYLEGIKEGRRNFKEQAVSILSVDDRIANIRATLKTFSFNSPVGQLLRGELDFWKNQQKRKAQHV